MKANKKTLMAVKAFLENDVCVDKDELISDLVINAGILKSKKYEEIEPVVDECVVKWGTETICSLAEFLEQYTDAYTKSIIDVLDSFVGEDISYLLEDTKIWANKFMK